MRQSGIVVGQIEEGSAVEESVKVDAKEWKDLFKSYFIQVFTLLMKLFSLPALFLLLHFTFLLLYTALPAIQWSITARNEDIHTEG